MILTISQTHYLILWYISLSLCITSLDPCSLSCYDWPWSHLEENTYRSYIWAELLFSCIWDLIRRATPLTSERLLDFCSCGMSHSSVISITLDNSVIIFLLQTMEILIKRISLNAGMITMFSKQHIQGILMITFTLLSRVQTHTYLVYVRYILRR